ncbi:thioredoxin domain-containing protein [Clostridium sp. BJN0001]|uniref:thioredoxin family protein n=1 Tax=Clostridium sp. BJN0001 TaxID=2930219 RepID=UPI001FD0F1D0|nr:thioredoxin domain-containing protein [Clostridium sp. BJN0001]
MKKDVKILISVVIVILVLGVVSIKKLYSENVGTTSEKTAIKSETTNETTVVKGMPMLIDLGAGTCMPCKEMVPVLAEVKEVYEGKAVVNVIDVNDHPEEADKYGIRVIPTQVFLDKDGKEFFRHEGFFSKEEIVKVFEKMGVN